MIYERTLLRVPSKIETIACIGNRTRDLTAMYKLLSVACLFAILSAPARAEMCRVGMMPSLNLCKRCTVDFGASTRRDTGCMGAFSVGFGTNTAAGVGNLSNLDAKVAARPQHGSVTIQGKGSSWTYTPAKGFVGRDTFTLERDFLSNDQLYVMYFRVTMDVTP